MIDLISIAERSNIMAKIEYLENHRVFFQIEEFKFKSKDGWIIETHQASDDFTSIRSAILIQPDGTSKHMEFAFHIGEETCDDGKKIQIVTHLRRYGRSIKNNIKIGPAHLPKGTVFTISGFRINDDEEPMPATHTVESIMMNGPGSCVIKTTDVRQSGYFKGEALCFNIGYVDEILYRPSISKDTVFVSEKLREHSLDLTGRYVLIRDLERYIYYRLSPAEYNGRRFNSEKLIKRLEAMGMVKRSQNNLEEDRWSECSRTYIDRARAIKFLKKNPHWAFLTIKESSRLEQEEWNACYSMED